MAVAKEKLSTAMELLFICMLHLLIIEARPALVHLVTVSTEHHAALLSSKTKINVTLIRLYCRRADSIEDQIFFHKSVQFIQIFIFDVQFIHLFRPYILSIFNFFQFSTA